MMEDILYAMVASGGGTIDCEMCEYENKRDMPRAHAVGAEKFGDHLPLAAL